MHTLFVTLLQTVIWLPVVFGADAVQATDTIITPMATPAIVGEAPAQLTPVPNEIDAARKKTPTPTPKPTKTPKATKTPTPAPALPPLRRLAVRLKDFDDSAMHWTAGPENEYTQAGYTCVERYFFAPLMPGADDQHHVWSSVCLFDTVAQAEETFFAWAAWDTQHGFAIPRPYPPLVAVDNAFAGLDDATQLLKESWYRVRKGRLIFSIYFYAERPDWATLVQCEAATLRRITNPDVRGYCTLE